MEASTELDNADTVTDSDVSVVAVAADWIAAGFAEFGECRCRSAAAARLQNSSYCCRRHPAICSSSCCMNSRELGCHWGVDKGFSECLRKRETAPSSQFWAYGFGLRFRVWDLDVSVVSRRCTAQGCILSPHLCLSFGYVTPFFLQMTTTLLAAAGVKGLGIPICV